MFWKRRVDEDDVDRVNRVWTVLIFVVAGVAGLVFTAVFPDDAISCHPVNPKETVLQAYANRYCLDEGNFPPEWYNERTSTYSYHSLVPLFLFYQAIGFLAPHILAQFSKRLKRSPAESLFSLAGAHHATENSVSAAVYHRPSRTFFKIFMAKKFFALLNSIIQLVAVAVFLSPDKKFSAITEPLSQGSSDTPFPRYGRCQISIQNRGAVIYQCAFHVNSVYQKFYMFLFYWLILLAFVNLVSLVMWHLLVSVPAMTSDTISTYTKSSKEHAGNEKGQAVFVKDFLGKDYLLCLLLAQVTEKEATAADLTRKLWQDYRTKESNNGVETSQM